MTTYKELLAQRQALDAQINEARAVELKSAIENVQRIVAEFGLSQADVFPATRTKRSTKGQVVEPKYRDPATGSTWTGRGKPPSWIKDKDRAQFAI